MFDFSWSNILHSNVINFAIMIAVFAIIIKKLNVAQKIEDMRSSIQKTVEDSDVAKEEAKKDYDAVMNTVFDGAIILMHDLYPATAEAVEKLIPDLMAKGYKFVTVSELMEARGYTLQNGKTYSQARPK